MKIYCNCLFAFLVALLFSANIFGMNTTDSIHVKRIITFTTQNSLKLETSFDELPAVGTKFSLKITDVSSGDIIFNSEVTASSTSKEEKKLNFSIANLKVNEWSPVHPNLYQLTFTASNQQYNNQEIQRIGFRSFESKNGNLYLNGHPVFLRGIAINPPGRGIPHDIETSRKFAHDYVSFMKSLHVNIIRIPDDSTWYNVCDELGMMVFGGNYSGTVDGQKPPKDYDKAVGWYENEKFAPIAYHPSLMIYAMSNEVDFSGSKAEPWRKFLSYAHDKLLKWDDTRVYIGNAGYGYGQSGDICDLHRYWGWYYSSPFTFLHARYNSDIIPFKKEKQQPVTFTECVGNYTGPDGKYNLTPHHKNPGAQLNWTGHADWDLQKQLANEHQSFTFKQATELNRRLRNINSELSGLFPFTILFYNWNTIKSFVDMDPKPVAYQARLSYNPVLLSWENWQPHLYAGATFHPIVHVVNDADDFSDLENAKLIYRIEDHADKIVYSDTINLPLVKYYATWQQKLNITIPSLLAEGDYQLSGKIIVGKKLISENFDQLFIAGKDFMASSAKPVKQLLIYDPEGKTISAIEKLAVAYKRINDLRDLPINSVIIIGENAADNNLVKQNNLLSQFVKNGGRVIFLRQDVNHFENLNKVLPYKLKNVTMDLDTAVYPPPPRPSRNGYNINPERADNPVFAGVDRANLRVWSDYTNWDEAQKGFPAIYPVTDGFVLENKKDLEHIAVLANYGVALESMALVEIFEGKGSEIVCGLDLVSRSGVDPVADKILSNMIGYSGNEKMHQEYPLINAPIIWGDYKTEKGVLTGVNSGLILNTKARITDDFRKLKIQVTKDGYEIAGAEGGWNTSPGLQYVYYGRRPFGPYILRGFGNVPEPENSESNIGQGTFWCSIPSGKSIASTLVWNSSDEDLAITITVNKKEVTRTIKAGETTNIVCPLSATNIEMNFSGDRRLVLLQTTFK